MPKFKNLIKHTEIEIAKAKRTCKFTKDVISKGDICLVVYEDARDRYCYSKQVALKMLASARDCLNDIERQLNS